jgi:hypothetical protein
MDVFLISIEKDEYGFYRAVFSDGTIVDLNTDNYTDAVCEADMLV